MFKRRIVAALDIRDGKVIKNVQYFNDSKIIGEPDEIAKKYEEQGAEEFTLLDITATTDGRETIYPVVKKTVAAITIPLTVGGGVRTVADFNKLFECGAARVFVNSGAVTNPTLIKEAAKEFGSEKIVAAVDAKMTENGWKVFIAGGNKNTGLDLVEWCKVCAADGAGEILLTSMDGDGMRTGYDIPMLNAAADSVDVPVVASGGCGTVGHIIDVFRETKCQGALVASLLHFGIATVAEIRAELERNGL